MSCQAEGTAVLEVNDLHARVSGAETQILNGVNLVIKEGEVIFLIFKLFISELLLVSNDSICRCGSPLLPKDLCSQA